MRIYAPDYTIFMQNSPHPPRPEADTTNGQTNPNAYGRISPAHKPPNTQSILNPNTDSISALGLFF